MNEQQSKAVRKSDEIAAEVAHTCEWLIIAFVLALTFRAFIMEAYRIPTGSMADTLKGAHFDLSCIQCGYHFDYGINEEPYTQAGFASDFHDSPSYICRCPSCGYFQRAGQTNAPVAGDRILVLKCIYQFFEPQQWDVVVFKNPLEPNINYIKRLLARPGETIEIIDGDVYINGRISRKPEKVKNELLMPVYDNDYQPVNPEKARFNGRPWQNPFIDKDHHWHIDSNDPTAFVLNGPDNRLSQLHYDASIGNDFRATYAYDEVRNYDEMPYCSDLMVRFYIRPDSQFWSVGVALSKYETNYRALIDSSGKMTIESIVAGEPRLLTFRNVSVAENSTDTCVEFSNIDHELVLKYGEEKLTYDLGRLPDDAGPRETEIQSQVSVLGSGKLSISHVAVFRDIHYTEIIRGVSSASEGQAVTLNKGEYFVAGDNSPESYDSRYWTRPGIGNNQKTYRKGIVPHEYLIGKAMFVYWPSGYEVPLPEKTKEFLFKKSLNNVLFQFLYGLSSLNCIPNYSQIRFIYGGKKEKAN